MANRLLVGTRKGLFCIERNASGWDLNHATLLGDPITMVLADRNGYIHAAVEHGHFGVQLKRSSDGGQSWQDRPTPKYPPKPDEEEDLDPVQQTSVPWGRHRS